MERKILHIDVNNAFLSWTAVDLLKHGETLDIRTIPAIIGGDESKRKGIVLAKSMPAKKLGIKTAEPIYFARQKCPNLKIFSSNFKIYQYYSDQLYQLFLEYTNKVERFSIDECFLDITNEIPTGKTTIDIAKQISNQIKENYGFTVNIGIAPNKLLAKMASDFEKPDKIHTLERSEIASKMWNLPVDELFMVGKKSLPKLEKIGIKTIGDLAKTGQSEIIKLFGKYGKVIWEYANGIDETEVIAQREQPKCIGNSITLPKDMNNLEEIEKVLLALVEQTTYRLRKHQLLANTIGVQIKTSDFKNYSHQKTIANATDSTKIIYEEAKKLLKGWHNGQPIRLLGIKVDNLCTDSSRQISLFDTKNYEKQEKLDHTIDKIKEKYGYHTITRAGNLQNKIDFKDE